MSLNCNKKSSLISLIYLGAIAAFLTLTTYLGLQAFHISVPLDSQIAELEMVSSGPVAFLNDAMDEDFFHFIKVPTVPFFRLVLLVLSDIQEEISIQRLHFLFLDIPPPFLL